MFSFLPDQDFEEVDSDTSMVSVKVGPPLSHQCILKVPKSIKELKPSKEAKPSKGSKAPKVSKAAKEPSEADVPKDTNPADLNKFHRAQKTSCISLFFCDGKQYVLVDRIGRFVSTFYFSSCLFNNSPL